MHWTRDRTNSIVLIIAAIGMVASTIFALLDRSPIWEIAWRAIYKPVTEPDSWDKILYTNYYAAWIGFAATLIGSLAAIISLSFAVYSATEETRRQHEQRLRECAEFATALRIECGIVMGACQAGVTYLGRIKRIYGVRTLSPANVTSMATNIETVKFPTPRTLDEHDALPRLGLGISTEGFYLRNSVLLANKHVENAEKRWRANPDGTSRTIFLRDVKGIRTVLVRVWQRARVLRDHVDEWLRTNSQPIPKPRRRIKPLKRRLSLNDDGN